MLHQVLKVSSGTCQQGSEANIACEEEIVCTQIILLQIIWLKNFEDRSTFAKVIIKH